MKFIIIWTVYQIIANKFPEMEYHSRAIEVRKEFTNRDSAAFEYRRLMAEGFEPKIDSCK